MSEIDDKTRAAIYAAMTDDEEAEDSIGTKLMPIDESRDFTTVIVNEKKVQVPTLEYTRRLEQTIQQQGRTIQRFERQFNRMASLLRTHRSSLNGQSNRINDVVRDLDSKIDRRD